MDEFIVMDYFMDVVSGFREIEGRLQGREWTEEENNILKKYYPVEGYKEVIDRLEGRTRGAINLQAKKLGIKAPDNTWTEEENDILKEYYPSEGCKVANRLNGRTKKSIKMRVNKLGIKYQKKNKYKYVHKNGSKYMVEFTVDGKMKYFGLYNSEEEAAKVAMQKAKEYGKAI